MLALTFECVGRGVIMFCHGRIVWGEEDALLRAALFLRDCDRLTLDLAGITSIDARGLGTLATVAKWATREGVTFAISNPTRRVYDLIHLVNLDSVIPVLIVGPPSGMCVYQELAAGAD